MQVRPHFHPRSADKSTTLPFWRTKPLSKWVGSAHRSSGTLRRCTLQQMNAGGHVCYFRALYNIATHCLYCVALS